MSSASILKGERTPLLASGNGWPSQAAAGEWEDDDLVIIEDDEFHSPQGHSTQAVLAMFLPMTIGIFLVAADGAMVVSSYAAIGSEMKQLQKTSWISTGYLLTMTSFQPMYGRLSLLFGRKQTLLFAYFVFTLGSFLSGCSRSINQLVFARALAGIGGGGLSIVPTIILTDVVDIKSRGTWQGILNLIYSMGSAVGGPLGGLLVGTLGWRWSFFLQVPAMILAILMVSSNLHVDTPSQKKPFDSCNTESPRFFKSSFLQTLYRLDILGALTLILAISSLLLTLERLSSMCNAHSGSLSRPDTYIPLLLSFLLFLFFILTEFYISPHLLGVDPILPKHLVSNPSLLAAYLSNFFASAASNSLVLHFSLFLQNVLGENPAEAGVGLLPSVIGLAIGSLVGGIIIKKSGGFYWETVMGYGILFFGCVVVAIQTLPLSGMNVNLGILEAGFGVAGYGYGHAITTCLIALISVAGPEDQAIATSASYLFRSLGSALSLSAGNAIVQSVLVETIKENVDLAGRGEHFMDFFRLVTSSSSSNTSSNVSIPIFTEQPNLLRNSYRVALNAEFLFTCALALCAGICALFIRTGGRVRKGSV